jgi:hypothetical protein
MVLIRIAHNNYKPNCKYGFHDFQTVKENDDYKRERCLKCGKEITTKKDLKKSRKDYDDYMEAHQRDFLQPVNPYYKGEYGEPKE